MRTTALFWLTILCLVASSFESTLGQEWANFSLDIPTVSPSERVDFEGLLPLFEKEISENPTNADNFEARAGLWIRLQKYEHAIADAKEAIRLDPMSDVGYSWLGFALGMTEKYEQAIVALERALELGADKGSTYKVLANFRTKTGDNQGALRTLDEAIKVSADEPEQLALFHFFRGHLRASTGDAKNAETDFSQIVKLFPSSSAAYQSRASYYYVQKEWDKALADFEQALRRDDPKNPKYKYLTSLLISERLTIKTKERITAARDLCEKTEWKNWLALAIYADELFQTAQFDEGMKWLAKAIDLAPDDMKEPLGNRRKARALRSPFKPAE